MVKNNEAKMKSERGEEEGEASRIRGWLKLEKKKNDSNWVQCTVCLRSGGRAKWAKI